jgi:signal transduction histidine kinase/DNA-binding response OmpR family regulator
MAEESRGHTPRILVVDDDPGVARALSDLLSLHGYSVLRADSGEEALDTLNAARCDLVLLDIGLPGMSGLEACARMRERHGPSLPIVMLTGAGDSAASRRSYEAGVDDFLHKPLDTAALVLKVRSFLRQKTLTDEVQRHRDDAQSRSREMALLHEIGRDWSLIAEPAEFHGMVTDRLAHLIDAPVCILWHYDSSSRTLEAALPAFGLSNELTRTLRYDEFRSLWNFESGRPYVSNHARSDPRLMPEIAATIGADSLVLVPMMSEGDVLGMLAAANKPGGFTEAEVHLISILAGPAATFVRSRQIFDAQRQHSSRLERLPDILGAMAATTERGKLLSLTVSRVQKELGYGHVAFFAPRDGEALALGAQAGSERPSDVAVDVDRLTWALRGGAPLQIAGNGFCEIALPVRAGEHALGVLNVFRNSSVAFREEEANLLGAICGQLALALQKAASIEVTERMARQMATLYDLGLETSALRDLKGLFVKATEEAGRLIKADHVSAFRLSEADGTIRLFAAWARDPTREPYAVPVFRVGEGIAGRVARDWVPAMVNDAQQSPDFVHRTNPVGRILCVPLTHFDQERRAPTLFGVLNATRKPGTPRFTHDDLEYLTRFAGQLSIAVANSMAFAAERERSEQLALVNTLLREIAGNLSRERILETAVRRIQEAFHFSLVMIGIPDYEAGVERTIAAAGPDPTLLLRDTYPLHAGVTGRVLREKRTVLIPDVAEDPEYMRIVATTRSEVAMPILSGEDVVAVLNVESEEPRAFHRAQVITLETLADGIGIILRNAELYQALEQTNLKLVELDRLKSDLVNVVAHDFRAPLSGVLGYAELLEWKPDAPIEERVENAQAIIRAATHMAALVDKTLRTTRLETGHFPFEFGVVDLSAVIHGLLSRLPGDPRHPLAVEVPEDPLPCWADRDRIAEVVENLVSNASKYSPDGGPIRIAATVDGEMVTVAVTDRGIGIGSADLTRLFRPFSRVRTARTAEIEGSGLGLYICDRIVRGHGGRLWVESLPGEGSVFSFSLPLFGVAAQTRSPMVLVAAGDETTRRDVRRVAEEMGYGTHEVADGVEAVEAALRLRPAVVILDRILPRLQAHEVAERLKENPTTGAIPLFVLAPEGDLGATASLFKACVPKPIDRNHLASVLATLFSPA